MLIPCPHCGPRDLREFTCRGADPGPRPGPDASLADWDGWLHLRHNPAGPTDEHWQHSGGCRAWLVVTRDTRSHAVLAMRPAAAQAEAQAPVPAPAARTAAQAVPEKKPAPTKAVPAAPARPEAGAGPAKPRRKTTEPKP